MQLHLLESATIKSDRRRQAAAKQAANQSLLLGAKFERCTKENAETAELARAHTFHRTWSSLLLYRALAFRVSICLDLQRVDLAPKGSLCANELLQCLAAANQYRRRQIKRWSNVSQSVVVAGAAAAAAAVVVAAS